MTKDDLPKNERVSDAKAKMYDALFAFLITIAAAIVSAYAFASAWRWFVVPATHWAEIRPLTAFGIAGVVNLIRTSFKEQDLDYKAKRPVRLAFTRLIFDLCMWGILWSIHWFGG